MVPLDYIFIFLALLGSLAIGGIYSTRMTDSKVMFVAGKRSSWWISGLSGYMTAFSAGTFVVWGGIAFRQGLVAVSILMSIGISLIFIGLYIAGRWRRLGVNSPAEYLGLRFGSVTVTLYSLIGMLGRGISVAVALYSIAIIIVPLIPVPGNSFLFDPATGHISVKWAILIIGCTTIIYTVAGGLWAVLMTDVIQFLILSLMVLILVPLSLKSVGGVSGLIENVPDGFFHLAGGQYTFIWLIIWFASNFFLEGGDFAFVQRYLCVPDIRSAKKSAYLMAVLYLISPILWMLPAMAYRIVDPGVNPEQAYILAGQHLLPAGLLGLMVAAMFSATASMVSGMLNVFAGVLTHDIYKPYINPDATEKKLVSIGRLLTLLFGIAVLILAILIPKLGGAERVVIALITMLIGPLGIPAVWGLFSKHINQRQIWATMGISYALGILIKVANALIMPLTGAGENEATIANFVHNNQELLTGLVGIPLPLIILAIMEWKGRRKGVDAGWLRIIRFMEDSKEEELETSSSSFLPDRILLGALFALSVIVGWVGISSFKDQKVVLIAALILLTLAVVIIVRKRREKRF